MQIVISGSRDIHDYSLLKQAIAESGFVVDTIIHGDASGVDRLGARYADEHSLPQIKFPADWNKHGRAAGPIRNGEMIESVKGKEAGFIAIWDGRSRGTFDCIKKAHAAGLPIYVKCLSALTTAPKKSEN